MTDIDEPIYNAFSTIQETGGDVRTNREKELHDEWMEYRRTHPTVWYLRGEKNFAWRFREYRRADSSKK